MSIASGFLRSTLNPNAAPFIPSSFQRVEDFSPEWWELVKTSTWFQDYWVDQHQGLIDDGSSNVGAEDDIAALLPENFELEEFPDLLQETTVFQPPNVSGLKQEKLRLDIAESLGLKSPRVASWSAMERTKYSEKPTQCISPKTPSRRIIQQPR